MTENDPEWLKRAAEQTRQDAEAAKAEAKKAYDDIIGDKFKPKSTEG